jgi:hypothetical protein
MHKHKRVQYSGLSLVAVLELIRSAELAVNFGVKKVLFSLDLFVF